VGPRLAELEGFMEPSGHDLSLHAVVAMVGGFRKGKGTGHWP